MLKSYAAISQGLRISSHAQGMKEEGIHSNTKCKCAKRFSSESQNILQQISFELALWHFLIYFVKDMQAAAVVYVLLCYSYGSEGPMRLTNKKEKKNQYSIFKVICAWNETN